MIILGYSWKKVTKVSAEVLISTNKKTEWKTSTNKNKVCDHLFIKDDKGENESQVKMVTIQKIFLYNSQVL